MLMRTRANTSTRLHLTKYVSIMWVRTHNRVQGTGWRISEGFFLVLHWGIWGPIDYYYFLPFQFCWNTSCILKICLCKNTLILLSFEVWVTKIIHVWMSYCVSFLLHLSTWLRMRVWWRIKLLIGIWIAWNAVTSLKCIAEYQVITMHNFKCIVPWWEKEDKLNEMSTEF